MVGAQSEPKAAVSAGYGSFSSTRAVVVAAPASGSGKTTIATGIMGALRAQGQTVAGFKVGPDYIDPGYHSIATGRPGRNLDPNLVRENRIGPLFLHGSDDADIAVIEGVMGLFDGRISDSDEHIAFGSTAHIAQLIHAPVVLVVDARGYSHSLGALLHGFQSYAAEVSIAGVILNQVGSARHEAVLTQACDRVGLRVLGCVPRDAEVDVPSRHLGLVTAAEFGLAAQRCVAAMTELVAKHVDVEAIRSLATSAVVGEVWDPSTEVDAIAGSPTIAVATGAAFSFGYAEHLELLTAAGANVVTFDPLIDQLPSGTDGLIIPGGFPELHAGELSANAELRNSIHNAANAGLPIHAECAGLAYLTNSIDGVPMVGAIDVETTFTRRLTLGYRDAVALADSALWEAGERVTGHEFHRTQTSESQTSRAWGWRTDVSCTEGVIDGHVHASYLHTHPAGSPHAVQRFVETCSRYGAR